MNKGWIRQLTPEAEDDRADFEAKYGDAGCTCFISHPCEFCLHPGNPHNQDEDDECWEEVLDFTQPGREAQRARIKRNIERTVRAFIGRKVNRELADLMTRCAHFGTRHGWGRKGRKRAKLELRGTYQWRGQNIEDAHKKKIQAATDGLVRMMIRMTGVEITPKALTESFTDAGVTPTPAQLAHMQRSLYLSMSTNLGPELQVGGVCHG